MTTDLKEKPKHDEHVSQFISPFPLLGAKSRLQSRKEPGEWFAWKWQQRVHVETWNVDNQTVRFSVRYVPRTMFQWDMGGIFSAQVRGVLRETPDGKTAVHMDSRIGLFIYFWNWLFVFLFAVMIAVMFITALVDIHPSIIVLLFGFGVLFGVVGMNWYLEFHQNNLRNMVEQTLKGATYWDDRVMRELEREKQERGEFW
jgi:hypothetical protein